MNADRILIAETEPEVLELYRRELERVGYDVACASQEEDLLNRIREDPPDLIILDLHLGGLEALAKVLDEAPRVPVILTSRCDIRCYDDFRTWLADSAILKSSDVRELKQAVRRVLARRAPSDEGRRLDPVHS
jgi:DNA-binding response OmpR family regulator